MFCKNGDGWSKCEREVAKTNAKGNRCPKSKSLIAAGDSQREIFHALIEAFDEYGFPDPKRVTSDDLPLIASRIALIEQLAPFAMDQVNADAFAEAHKDLTNMLVKASQP